MNFVGEIAKTAARYPHRPALIDSDRTLTYANLMAAVADLAGRLRSIGVAPGDIMALRLKDNADHIIAIMALGWLGAGSASLDWRAKPSDTVALAERMNFSRLLVEKSAPVFDAFGGVAVADLLAAVAPDLAPSQAVESSDATFVVNLSSGTTGIPRGVAVTHQQYADRKARYFANYGDIDGFRYLSISPLCFSAGRNWCFFTLLGGATIVMHPTLFTGKDFLDAVKRHRINMGSLVPTALRWLLEIDGPTPLLPDFKMLAIGGDAVHPDEKRLAKARLTPKFYSTYSTSGTGNITTMKPGEIDDHAESVGRPSVGVELQIVDDRDRPLAPCQQGFVRCRGPGIATDEAVAGLGDARSVNDGTIRDGWFYTGELGSVDEDGFLYIHGRASNIIIRGAVNIFPGEIEDVIQSCAGVQEVAVVGKPSAELGETVAAFVVVAADTTADTIKRHCRTRLAPQKVPEDVLVVERLPRTTSGKVVKTALVDRLADVS